MGQLALETFLYSRVKETCLEIPLKATSRRALSERLAKKRLEKKGWTVWRGGLFSITKREEIYPSVLHKYTLLLELMEKHYPGKVEALQYLCDVHHGMPDFVCYKDGIFRFVECKLIYETLSLRQKRCLKKLAQLGFPVEVMRLVDKRTMKRRAVYDVQNGRRKILECQERIKTAKAVRTANEKKVFV
ncbi:MAG: VRR-NUC domain-containing protein [Nanoarchaeota archaeon]